jgi:hypothetical protein
MIKRLRPLTPLPFYRHEQLEVDDKARLTVPIHCSKRNLRTSGGRR